MASDNAGRPLIFEFVIDPRLARDRNEFRFRVSLDERGVPTRRGIVDDFGGHDVERVAAVQWCRPLLIGTGMANVLAASGATTGTICAYGKAYDDAGYYPHEVRGMIVPAAGDLPNDPPEDAVSAEMVNGSGQNVFPGACNFEPNFVFRTGNGSAEFIPNVQHSSTGVTNYLVVWIKVGAFWSCSPRHAFRGKTATIRDCEALEEKVGAPSLAFGSVAPDGESSKLRILLGSPRGVLATDVLLSRVKTPDADRVWNSCPIRDPSNDWKLWVETRAGKPYATLCVRKLFGTKLEAPLLWRSEAWNPAGPNRLDFDSPTELLGNVPSHVDVRPA